MVVRERVRVRLCALARLNPASRRRGSLGKTAPRGFVRCCLSRRVRGRASQRILASSLTTRLYGKPTTTRKKKTSFLVELCVIKIRLVDYDINPPLYVKRRRLLLHVVNNPIDILSRDIKRVIYPSLFFALGSSPNVTD